MKPEHPQFLDHFARVNVDREADRLAANLDRDPPYLSRRAWQWILIAVVYVVVMLLAAHVVGRAIEQAAYDAVQYGTEE